MYQYGYPNFRRYLREGLVRIPEHSMIGFTRGGTGLAVHQSHRSSRIQGWWVIHQGPPAHFVRTGPIWKGWLYYVDFTRDAWFRLGGVLGERLLAFGSSDPKDLSMDMLSSSDWEGGRDGVDDADLARMVEWFLPRLQARATGAWKERLKAIEAERALWFTDRSPFPIGQKPVDYRVAREGQPLLEYHITQASAAATTDIEKAKRYMVRLLLEMAPHTAPQDVQVSWHDWMLVRDGRAVATVVVSPAAADRTKAAAASIVKRIESATGLALPLRESDALDQIEGLKVLVGEASDRPVAALCLRNEWQLDDKYPGAGDYRIRRLPDQKVIAIMGVDQPGVERGVRSWLAFLNPQGHWLLSR
jgi:hypothetical protein